MNENEIKMNESLEFLVNGWEIAKLDIDYFNETITLLVESVKQQSILRTRVSFKEVLSYYVYQEEVVYNEDPYETYRLNNREKDDSSFVSEIGYHPNGFAHIKIKSLDSELTAIEEITSKTNLYFQVNNKDHFFIECNVIEINDETFEDLIQTSDSLRIT